MKNRFLNLILGANLVCFVFASHAWGSDTYPPVLDNAAVKRIFQDLMEREENLPEKDPFMKEREYCEVLEQYKKENPVKKLVPYRIKQYIDVPCKESSEACYDPEKEEFVIRPNSLRVKSFLSEFKTETYKGQTILQKNMGTSTKVESYKNYEDVVKVYGTSGNTMRFERSRDKVKNNFKAYTAYAVVSIDQFHPETELSFKRVGGYDATIDRAVSREDWARKILAKYEYSSIFFEGTEIFKGILEQKADSSAQDASSKTEVSLISKRAEKQGKNRKVPRTKRKTNELLVQATVMVQGDNSADAVRILQEKLEDKKINAFERAQIWQMLAYAYYTLDDIPQMIYAFEEILKKSPITLDLELQALRNLFVIHASESRFNESTKYLNLWKQLGGVPDAFILELEEGVKNRDICHIREVYESSKEAS